LPDPTGDKAGNHTEGHSKKQRGRALAGHHTSRLHACDTNRNNTTATDTATTALKHSVTPVDHSH
jgi:hypothetical protein